MNGRLSSPSDKPFRDFDVDRRGFEELSSFVGTRDQQVTLIIGQAVRTEEDAAVEIRLFSLISKGFETKVRFRRENVSRCVELHDLEVEPAEERERETKERSLPSSPVSSLPMPLDRSPSTTSLGCCKKQCVSVARRHEMPGV